MMSALNMAYDIEESRPYIIKKVIGILTTMLTLILIISALILPNAGIYVMSYIRKIVPIPMVF